MSDDLYAHHANLYSEIANDRDFTKELNLIKAFDLPVNGTFVELFAGPAYHSIHLHNKGWGGKIVAIDNSKAMKNVSNNLGFKGDYLCSDAIDGLDQVSDVNIIFIPRYSIVLVNKEYACRLFSNVAKSLNINGVFFIEIHKDSNIENQLYIGGNWETLGIHKRVVKTSLGKIECIWPYTTKMISSDEKIVDMSVKITVEKNNSVDEHIFISREHLHTKHDILNFADKAGLRELKNRSCELADSYLLAFELKKTPDESNRLNNLSFNRIFDISTHEACSTQIHKSGLDPIDHDSPLSLHVYNLL